MGVDFTSWVSPCWTRELSVCYGRRRSAEKRTGNVLVLDNTQDQVGWRGDGVVFLLQLPVFVCHDVWWCGGAEGVGVVESLVDVVVVKSWEEEWGWREISRRQL